MMKRELPQTSVEGLVGSSPRLPKLRSDSPVQRRLAASLRASMIREARRHGDPERIALLTSVDDARWFIVNSSRSYDAIRSPSPRQLTMLESDHEETR